MEWKFADIIQIVENFFLVLFTYLLYSATIKLWKVSENQRSETRDAINLTRESLEISKRDQDIHLRSVELAQKTFIHENPPLISILVCQISFGLDPDQFTAMNRLNGSFLIMNQGGTRARVTDVDAAFFIRENRLPLLQRVHTRHATRQLAVTDIWLMPAGEMEALVDSLNAGFSPQLANDFNDPGSASGWRLFFQGWVRYEDEIGNQKTKFFCHEFNRVTRGFEPISVLGYERTL